MARSESSIYAGSKQNPLSSGNRLATLIDGKTVVVSAKAGSTVVTISADTLEKLSAGTHTVTVKFDDGQVTTKLTVKNRTASTDAEPSKPADSNPSRPTGSRSPQTGDNSNIGLWLALSSMKPQMVISRKKIFCSHWIRR